MSASGQVMVVAEYPVGPPRDEVGGARGDHETTAGANVLFDGAGGRYGLHVPAAASTVLDAALPHERTC